MPTDATTFLAAFLAIFLGLAWYLWHIDRKLTMLERKLAHASAINKDQPGNDRS